MYLINVWKQTIHVILYSVVVFTLTFWVRDLGSIPLQHYFVFFWKNNQTLRAKITLFPRKDLHLNLPKWSTNTTCSFKPKKFTVGHFDLDRNSCLRKIHTVKKLFRKVKKSSEVSISSFHIETWKALILTTRWRKQVDEINIQFLNICVNSSNRSAQKFECRKYLNMCQDTLQLSVHIFSPFFPRFNFKSKLRFGFHMAYSC